MRIPEEEKKIIKLAQEQIEVCGVSSGNRTAAYQLFSTFIETGKGDGEMALANTLHAHEDRLSSHLFCPTDARFTLDFENTYPEKILQQGKVAARQLTKAFNRKNFDITFANGVEVALNHGAAIVKITGKTGVTNISGREFTHIKSADARIIPPWLFGVENEGRNNLVDQEAMIETVYLNKYDVWRRIHHMENADKLYKRIMSHSTKTGGSALPSAFINLLSASALNIAPGGSNPPSPGGITTLSGSGNAFLGTNTPQILSEQYEMTELWVKDDKRGDWLMIQMIAPDVLIAPRYKFENAFCDQCLPYILVQPNIVPGYFWGRSEVMDLLGLQGSLSETMDDFKRLMGLQYDGRYSFEGFDGVTDEMFDDFRSSGWVNGRAGSKVTDMTPKLPPEAIVYIKLIREMMDDVSGFGNILSGQGESGVRAGNHANTLMKTASPRLRDRSLVVERQYAAMGDTYLSYMEAKDGNQYYTDPEKPEETAFLLDQIPEDRSVQVDSHSSSPIYENDHNQLVVFGLKSGLIGGDDAIEMLNFPNRDELKRKWVKKAEAQAELIQKHPELLAKGGHGKK